MSQQVPQCSIAQPLHNETFSSTDEERANAPPSSQPRPVEDDDESMTGDVHNVVDDFDQELADAEARRKMLANTLGGGEDESSEEDSDVEEQAQIPTAIVPSMNSQPTTTKIASVPPPKVKLSKKERMNKTAAKQVAAEEPQPPHKSTVEIVRDIETFVRGHDIWKLAKTKKEFNKAFFPYFKEKLGLDQKAALDALTELRQKWEVESEARLEKERVEKRAKQARILRAPRAIKEPKTVEIATVVHGNRAVDDADVTMSEAPTVVQQSVESPHESPVANGVTDKPCLSKAAAKRASKRVKTAENKLNLVHAKEWYNTDKQEAPIVEVAELSTPVLDETITPIQKLPKKKIKRGPTESSHFASNGSMPPTTKPTSKAAREKLISSLAGDLMQKKPSLANGDESAEEADDEEREPTYFSAGGTAPILQETEAVQTSEIKKGKQPALTKKQRKAIAAERNRERQLAKNQAASDPNIERTVVETKKAEQSASFMDMAKKAREAVKAAAATVEKTVRDNGRIQKEGKQTTAAPTTSTEATEEPKLKRKRKRNNNRLSDADAQPVIAEVIEHEQPTVETKRPLETAIVNEQISNEQRPKKRRNRKPKEQARAERAAEESKEAHS